LNSKNQPSAFSFWWATVVVVSRNNYCWCWCWWRIKMQCSFPGFFLSRNIKYEAEQQYHQRTRDSPTSLEPVVNSNGHQSIVHQAK